MSSRANNIRANNIRKAMVSHRRNSRTWELTKSETVADRFCVNHKHIYRDPMRAGWFVPEIAVQAVGPRVIHGVPCVFPGDQS